MDQFLREVLELKRIKHAVKNLTKFELALWCGSLLTVSAAFLCAGQQSWLSLAASLIGVTALIFVAKGDVIGQVLTVVFSVFYGVISFTFRYYGEMITYLCMTAPIAVMAVISWARHPYQGEGAEVEVSRLRPAETAVMFLLAAAVTLIFCFILKAFRTANLALSTVSITTSFLASYLTFRRSAWYAAAYAANDLVLILLWVLAAAEDMNYLPMVVCFGMFFVNDLYGFVNWSRMKKAQRANAEPGQA